jgi:hypothetical protein
VKDSRREWLIAFGIVFFFALAILLAAECFMMLMR